MLNNIRKFSKTIFAKILLVIIIIPFVFWGMGGVFSGGNTNNIAKINNKNISTQDFVNYINSSKISLDYIKDNVGENIIEELLGELISKIMLSMEIKDLELLISDKILYKRIKENKNFFDENNKFSRTKYEKFLLSNNLSAPEFEKKLRNNELKKILFNYISGGIKSPLFSINNIYKEETKKVSIEYINLEYIYKKRESFSEKEISKFIEENKDNLKEKIISFNYSKIVPKNLIGIDEYNNLFFEKIDQIEDDISNGIKFDQLISKYELKSITKQNFKLNDINNNDLENIKLFNKIFDNAKDGKIELLDENDYYILYAINNINKALPKINDPSFEKKIRENLFNKSKFKFNSDLMKKITKKSFTQSSFDELSKTNLSEIEKIIIQSINDNSKFSTESVKYLYSLSKNDFSLIADETKNIFLAKILNISQNNISKNSENFKKYYKQTNISTTDKIYETYDLLLSDKYKVKINQKTLERVKNYFR